MDLESITNIKSEQNQQTEQHTNIKSKIPRKPKTRQVTFAPQNPIDVIADQVNFNLLFLFDYYDDDLK